MDIKFPYPKILWPNPARCRHCFSNKDKSAEASLWTVVHTPVFNLADWDEEAVYSHIVRFYGMQYSISEMDDERQRIRAGGQADILINGGGFGRRWGKGLHGPGVPPTVLQTNVTHFDEDAASAALAWFLLKALFYLMIVLTVVLVVGGLVLAPGSGLGGGKGTWRASARTWIKHKLAGMLRGKKTTGSSTTRNSAHYL